MVKNARAGGAALALDAGDSLLSGEPLEGAAKIEGRRRAEVMVAGLSEMGLDAYVPGEKDLALGYQAFREILKPARFPVIAANLREPGGQRPFPPGVVRRAGDLKVAILGLVDPAL